METLLGLIALAIVVVVYLRRWLLKKDIPQQQTTAFQGELFQIGEASLARRASERPSTTVIVVHGFVENFIYFSAHYSDPRIELIQLTCADYHVPVARPVHTKADWAKAPDAVAGTIAYDAAVLNLALEHLVSTRQVRVHGHSRGGAVTLEAARQRPDLFQSVEVILEAPVLPQGKPYRPLPAIARWLFPFYLALWQQQPISERNRAVWGSLDNPRKRELIWGFPFNARHCSTLVTNIQDMNDWMAETGTDVYRCVQRGAVVVPARDKVLDPRAMLASARQAENLQIIEVSDCSHFVTLDQPEAIPPLQHG